MRLNLSSLSILAGLTFSLLVIAGCGGSRDMPDLGAVTGEVTKDGVPYVGAEVEFYPEGHGAASYGKTDRDGKFVLFYSTGKPGAAVGTHKVTVIGGSKKGGDVAVDADADVGGADAAEGSLAPAAPGGPGGAAPGSATKKKLTAEVTEEGPNHIVLEL